MTRQENDKNAPASTSIASSTSSNSQKKSTSTVDSTSVVYYGSREPKQSIIETDRVLFQMMDDMQSNTTDIEKDWVVEQKQEISKTTQTGGLWRFRIVFSSIIILLLVVATVVVSEVTKEGL